MLSLLVGLEINKFVLDSFKESLLALIQSVKNLSPLFIKYDISEGPLLPCIKVRGLCSYFYAKRHFDVFGGSVGLEKPFMTFCYGKMIKHNIIPLCMKLTKNLDAVSVIFYCDSVPNEIVQGLFITKCLTLWLPI